MFRFTIRDILWLMVIIGFCLHAWTERFSRDVAWRRRVNEEVFERVAAEQRAKEAEERAKFADERAGRYARAAGQLQLERIWARHAMRAADKTPVSTTTDLHADSTASAPGGAFTQSPR